MPNYLEPNGRSFDVPLISIYGTMLDRGQASTLRVALCHFLSELSDESFMSDLGAIGPNYRDRALEIIHLMEAKSPLDRRPV